ncbi:MAG: FCD domain-containing protein [Deltaproteobacteria bacterium]|jgi:DNA-binding FadR family transcriptional regulator|nr:FCD domain-containing protein [Deltaproteobacteria bacterium]
MQDKAYVPRSHHAAEAICEMIFTKNRFQAGERIPSEPELAGAIGVSRTSIREAVRLLIARGVLEIKRGRGTFVTAAPDAANGLLTIAMIEDHRNLVRDWFEFRSILEPAAAKIATMRASAQDLDAIEHYERRAADNLGNNEVFDVADAQMHTAIAKATHNQVIERLVPFLVDSVAEARRRSRYIHRVNPDPVAAHAVITHRQVIELMRKGDAESASVAMAYHIKRAVIDLEL